MTDSLLALLNIIILDLVLSGDNAVVIGMAVHRLPPRQKRLATLGGGGLALVLRITLTALATFLLQIPLLEAGGALILLYITYKLLTQEGEGVAGAANQPDAGFGTAMRTIIIADVTMSIDNILAVGAAAQENIPLLIFGLLFSMAILIAGGTIVSVLIAKLSWLNYLGAAVLVVLAGQMFAEDQWLLEHNIIPHSDTLPWILSVIAGVILIGLLLLHRSRARARHEQNTLSGGPTSADPGAV